jgi:hypothetical protein
MQDWEWEVSDFTKLDLFLSEYKNIDITDDEKASLMEIILDSLNDLLYFKEEVKFNYYFPEVARFLTMRKSLHLGSLNYWTRGKFEISNKLKRI